MTARVSAPRIHLALTRSTEDAAPWVEALAARNIGASAHPCIEVGPVDDLPLLRQVTSELNRTTHIAVSSRHGARALEQHLGQALALARRSVSFLAVGPATARALAWTGAPAVQVMPACAEGLLTHLLRETRPERHHVLLPAAKNGRRLVIEKLCAAGISARHWPLYETRPLGQDDDPIRLPAETTHILFASPSQVAGFVSRQSWSMRWQALSLGPSTSRALRAAQIFGLREARHPTFEAVMDLLKRDLV